MPSQAFVQTMDERLCQIRTAFYFCCLYSRQSVFSFRNLCSFFVCLFFIYSCYIHTYHWLLNSPLLTTDSCTMHNLLGTSELCVTSWWPIHFVLLITDPYLLLASVNTIDLCHVQYILLNSLLNGALLYYLHDMKKSEWKAFWYYRGYTWKSLGQSLVFFFFCKHKNWL